MTDTIPLPIDLVSERCCLGAAMFRKSCLLTLMQHATEDMFYDAKNKAVFLAIKHCYKNKVPVNDSSVSQAFEMMNPNSPMVDTGYSFASYMAEGRVSYVGLQLPQLIANHRRHQLLKLASYLMINASDPDVEDIDLLVHCKKKMCMLSYDGETEIHRGDKIVENMFNGVSLIDAIKGNKPIICGYSTGYNCLDEKLERLGPGRFVVIGARAGVGKTQFMCQLIANMITLKTKCLVLSYEMDENEYMRRISGILLGKPHHLLAKSRQHSDEFKEYAEKKIASDKEYMKNLYIVNCCGKTAEGLDMIIEQFILEHGDAVVFLDHLGLVAEHQKVSSPRERVSYNSNYMKILAMKYKICLVSAAQLNRELEYRKDKKPQISDLKESGDIEQDADQVLLLSRRDDSSFLVSIQKNRHGNLSEEIFKFNPDTQTMDESRWY